MHILLTLHLFAYKIEERKEYKVLNLFVFLLILSICHGFIFRKVKEDNNHSDIASSYQNFDC